MNAVDTIANRQSQRVTGGMRSPRGFWGAILVLAMLPLTIIYQAVFAYGSGTFMHWLLAAGALLISFAVFDFKLPKWINWSGCLLAWGLAIIFFLQGLSDLVPNATLANLAYSYFTQYLELWLATLFIVVWCGALLLLDSEGKTRIFGFAVMAIYVAAEIVRLTLSYLGAPPIGMLRVLILLPVVWLLLECRKQAKS